MVLVKGDYCTMDEKININELFPEVYKKYKLNNGIFEETLTLLQSIKLRDDYPLCVKFINDVVVRKLGTELSEIHERFEDKLEQIDELDFNEIQDDFLCDFYIFYRCVEQVIIDSFFVKSKSSSLLRVVYNSMESEKDCSVIRLFTENNNYLDMALHLNDIDFLMGILNDLKNRMQGDDNG